MCDGKHTDPGVNTSAKARCNVPEFSKLLEMGPRIVPLVIYKMLDRHNFTAVFLCEFSDLHSIFLDKSLTTTDISLDNALERDTQFLIEPRDVLNFLVLQRQNNLIIDVNQRRRY